MIMQSRYHCVHLPLARWKYNKDMPLYYNNIKTNLYLGRCVFLQFNTEILFPMKMLLFSQSPNGF